MNVKTGERVSGEFVETLSALDKLDYVNVAASPKQAREALMALDSPRKAWMKNKPCPCGSGKKFKKCHWVMKKEAV